MELTAPPPQQVRYPDGDGRPMSDHTLQYRWIVTIKENLDILFAADPNVFVAGNLMWYPVERRPKVCAGPDVMVVFGRPKGERGSYKQWEEGGVAPQVVFEVLSPSNRNDEMIEKFNFFQRHGVEEYYLYDPFSGELDGWRRGKARLALVRDYTTYVSPRLGIRFQPAAGTELRIFRPDGQPFLTPVEFAAQRDAERKRADDEKHRADAAEARASLLADKLRELGIEPPG